MERKNKIYLLTFLFIVFFGLLSVAAFNMIIDPAAVFNIVEREGFNAEKTELMRGGGRRDKAVALKWKEFDTVILGSSRSEVGINPESSLFGKERVYNASLPFTHMEELHSVFKFVKDKTETKRVIIGLDFMLFTSKFEARGDYNESLFAEDRPVKILFNIFSLDELLRSIDTLRDNQHGKRARYSKSGHRYKMNTFKKLNGHRNSFNDKLIKGFRLFLKANPPVIYHTDRLTLLSSIINESKKAGIELILFISPTHVRQIETFRLLSLMDGRLIWQRDLTKLLSNNPQVKLWDFSGANVITTESIPPAGDAATEMRWYWEASHYKSVVGDMILQRVLGKETEGFEYSGFGVLLDTENIDRHLSDQRRAQETYRREYPKEINELEKLWKEATGL